MALSFIILPHSGFALKFPGARWAVPSSRMENTEAGWRLIHRIAAIVMVAVCAFHLGYVLLTCRPRSAEIIHIKICGAFAKTRRAPAG